MCEIVSNIFVGRRYWHIQTHWDRIDKVVKELQWAAQKDRLDVVFQEWFGCAWKEFLLQTLQKKCEHEKLKKKYKSHMEEKEKQVSSLKGCIAKLELEVPNGAKAMIKRQKTE